MSYPIYRVEVVADDTGEWIPNAMRFDRLEAAEAYARDLAWNWTACREWRIFVLGGRMVSWRLVRVDRAAALV